MTASQPSPCSQPDCTGTVQPDGFCDVCGLAPPPPAAASPASSASSASSGSSGGTEVGALPTRPGGRTPPDRGEGWSVLAGARVGGVAGASAPSSG
ncbi:hypothetical protein DZF91_32440, partial [Actinomadura logoneensis]